jgi:hypothetical protein
MAYQPMLRPDPFEERSSELPDPHESKKDDPSAVLYLACLARTLAAHGGGTSSADLALELVLNGIVEQAMRSDHGHRGGHRAALWGRDGMPSD